MKILFLALFFSLSFSSLTQATPEHVREAFRKKYPQAPEPTWEIDSNGAYEANFRIDGIKYRADFTTDGFWTETERNLEFRELPADVRAAIELKYQAEDVRDIEAVESATHGRYFALEFVNGTTKIQRIFDETGKLLDPQIPTSEKGFFQSWIDQASENTPLMRQGWSLVYKTLFNLLTIIIFAYLIYYRRHHDHKMLFLLLAFNLFLFPIFLSSSLVTAGFGFTIFALLALVRLRSEAFDKAEIAYLLGAISLTFVNTMMPAAVDVLSASIILLTALIADRPSVWRDSYQKIEVTYRITEKGRMLDQEFLRTKLADEYQIEVCELTINRVIKNDIRLTLMYRDLPEIRKAKRATARKARQEQALKKFGLEDQ